MRFYGGTRVTRATRDSGGEAPLPPLDHRRDSGGGVPRPPLGHRRARHPVPAARRRSPAAAARPPPSVGAAHAATAAQGPTPPLRPAPPPPPPLPSSRLCEPSYSARSGSGPLRGEPGASPNFRTFTHDGRRATTTRGLASMKTSKKPE